MFDDLHFLGEIRRPNHLLLRRKICLETATEWNGKRSLLWRDKNLSYKINAEGSAKFRNFKLQYSQLSGDHVG